VAQASRLCSTRWGGAGLPARRMRVQGSGFQMSASGTCVSTIYPEQSLAVAFISFHSFY